MAVYNANEMIKIIRKKIGLSQEKFCEGICSVQALYNIEHGKNGISPVTFEMLVARANIDIRPYPYFANLEDLSCFMDLHKAEFFVDSWQFDLAYQELKKVENNKFANNKFYYQRWLLLHCKMLSLSEKCDYDKVVENALHAIRISIPEYKRQIINRNAFTPTEISLFVILADSYIGIYHIDEALEIIDVLEKELHILKVSDAVLFSYAADVEYLREKIYLMEQEYEKLLKKSCEWYKKSTGYNKSIPLFHFSLMHAISLYKTGAINDAIIMFKEVIAGASLINSQFLDICLDYVKYNTDVQLSVFSDLICLTNERLKFSYSEIKKYDVSLMNDGTFSLAEIEVITYGKLLKIFRNMNKFTSDKVYNGLCSKSQYSKIENDRALPTVMLARALLERVGITENLFDFFGNEEEYEYSNLSEKIATLGALEKERAYDLITQLESLKISQEPIGVQEIAFFKSVFIAEKESKSIDLLNALRMTKKDFVFNNISSPLTNIEFNIAQHYIRGLLKHDDTIQEGICCVNSLIEYYEKLSYDVTQIRTVVPMLFFIVSSYLLKCRKYDELEKIYRKCDMPLMQYYVSIKALITMDYNIALMIEKNHVDRRDIIKKIKQAYFSMKLSTVNDAIEKSIDKKLETYGIIIC